MYKEGSFPVAWRMEKLILLLFLGMPFTVSGAFEDSKIFGVSGGTAELPCDTIPSKVRVMVQNPPPVILIVWYKDNIPVYSWDTRAVSGGEAHWSAPGFESRASWVARPPRLVLRPVKPKDAGRYRCRADFRMAPSKTTIVNLTVIEPPAAPRIFDIEGREVIGKAGPYHEGEKPIFHCVVTGGNPPPTIRWLRDEQTLASNEVATSIGRPYFDDSDDEYYARQMSKLGSDSHKKDRLTLKPIGLPLRVVTLRRMDLLAKFSCRANNSRLLPALSTTITIDMQLPPLTVEIEPREPLRAGHRETLLCRSNGARPPATISWLLQGTPLPAHTFRQEESDVGDVSTSILEIIVGRDQRGQQLACRATHPLLSPEESPLTVLTLDVLLPPDVSLRLGKDYSFDKIVEGDAIVLECNVLAHPPPYKISWEHNSRTIAHEPIAGVEIDWGKLTLPNIQRGDSGTYNCIASNVEGDTRSNTVTLHVLFAPVCRYRKEVGAIMKSDIKHQTELKCEVEANPQPTLFAWSFNSTIGLTHIPQDQYTWSETISTMKYVPSRKHNHEALCWATNKIGKQIIPCSMPLYTPRPAPPHNCALYNMTSSEFYLQCDHVNNARVVKSYELAVEMSSNGKLLANLTTNRPIFKVKSLPGGKELRLLVFAKNNYSRSDPQELFIIMPHPSSDFKGNANSVQSMLLFGMTASAFVLFIVTIIFLKFKYRLFKNYNSDDVKPNQIVTAVRDEDCSALAHEEKNPDVVPLNKVETDELAQMRAEQKWEVAARSPRLLDSESLPLATPPVSETSWSIRSLQGREVVTSRTPLPVTQESCV